MIEAIIFDFDGVIVDSEPLHYQAFANVALEYGVEFDYAFYGTEMLGFDDRDAFKYLAETFSKPILAEDLSELIYHKAFEFKRIVKEGIEAFDGVVDFVKACHAEYPIAISSGALSEDIAAILPHIDGGSLDTLFAIRATADMVSKSKPDPETYILAAKKLNVDPTKCIAIEDTPHGLQSAAGAGMKTIAVEHTYTADRLTDADKVVASFPDLSLDLIRSWFAE